LLEVIGVQEYSEFYDTRSSAERASGGTLKIGAQARDFKMRDLSNPLETCSIQKRLDSMFLGS
jgi:hypothetical protein